MTQTDESVHMPVTSVVTQQPKRRSSAFAIIIAIFLMCAVCGGFTFLTFALSGNSTANTVTSNGQSYQYVMGNESSDNKVLAIYIDQAILTSAQDYNDDVLTSLLVGQYVFGYRVKDQLMAAAKDDSIKAVIFMINSPGGTVAGARAIADGVEYYREATKKPVYAYVQDMAASGAYWAAVATDKIIAESGSMTGSIGVLMGPFEYYDKLVSLGNVSAQNGISITYITGGKYKDFGNPTKKMSEEELAILQKGINTEYDKFVTYVAARRNIKKETITEDVKALVYGAEEAKEYGLIDQIGNREDALAALALKANITDYQVVKAGTATSLFGSIFASLVPNNAQPKATTDAPARSCALCGKLLYFYGNPLDF